jgi:hypothetical protein
MTINEIKELFIKHADEYYHFDRIPKEARRHPVVDICVMLYLDEKLGCNIHGIINGAYDDAILFDYNASDLEKLTEEDVLYLTRCSVCFILKDTLGMYIS